jgi:hypothetical protein
MGKEEQGSQIVAKDIKQLIIESRQGKISSADSLLLVSIITDNAVQKILKGYQMNVLIEKDELISEYWLGVMDAILGRKKVYDDMGEWTGRWTYKCDLKRESTIIPYIVNNGKGKVRAYIKKQLGKGLVAYCNECKRTMSYHSLKAVREVNSEEIGSTIPNGGRIASLCPYCGAVIMNTVMRKKADPITDAGDIDIQALEIQIAKAKVLNDTETDIINRDIDRKRFIKAFKKTLSPEQKFVFECMLKIPVIESKNYQKAITELYKKKFKKKKISHTAINFKIRKLKDHYMDFSGIWEIEIMKKRKGDTCKFE